MENMQILIVLSALFALYWLYEVEYKRYRLDKFRDDLFVIRGKLFDAGARGEIPLDHPAYLTLRTNINGVIRFSHDLSFFRFMLMKYEVKSDAGRARSINYQRRMNESLASLTDSQRKLIIDTNSEIHKSVLLYIANNSLLGKALTVLVFLVAAILWVVKSILGKKFEVSEKDSPAPSFINMKIMRRPIEVLDAEANMVGCAA
ncbi:MULTISPECIES: hypothetical protein [Pseudomonas chlororaphis group]|uniref:hypothetical protein n=1 Tax=Pseudomonas chlororaphis group TaxID=136842 RepID=UPI0020968A03|nr:MULTISPECIES: hypothetical protein [Pseudomonas chlororaphis group]MCO7575311.1 hypothetical protein [Pseudomonas protegens]MCO7582586.1 hypothetical protein [Pseudomonas chlororaphis]MCO7599235.1 hypothetical protein [Pseudomonas chlororaphis]